MKTLMKGMMYAAMVCILVMMSACGDGPTLSKHNVQALDLTTGEKEINEDLNEFAVDMLREVGSIQSGNVFISPLSCSFACGMIANGAKGETLNQMLKAMDVEDYSMSELNTYYLKLMEKLPYQDRTSAVKIANGLWADGTYTMLDSYVDNVRTHFLATVDSLDTDNPEAAAETINNWASKQTEGLIKKVVDASQITNDAHIVVANALYFKGKWEDGFKRTDTRQQTFYSPAGEVETQMMNGEIEAAATPLFRYEEDERQEANERMLRLYYKDKGYCMDIIMPNTDFDTWLEAFDMDQYEDLCLALVHGDVTVSMPTFKMTKHYDLKPVMQKLGMEKVFTSGADLSGLTEENRLCLGVLQQDTYIEVDESGTKAAAVTSGILCDKADSGGLLFIADHPFIFFIRDVKNGVILFAGKYANPNS